MPHTHARSRAPPQGTDTLRSTQKHAHKRTQTQGRTLARSRTRSHTPHTQSHRLTSYRPTRARSSVFLYSAHFWQYIRDEAKGGGLLESASFACPDAARPVAAGAAMLRALLEALEDAGALPPPEA